MPKIFPTTKKKFSEQQKIFLTTNCRNRLIYLTSFSQHPSRFSQHFSQHNFQKRSTVWDDYGLSKRKFPYYYCVLDIFWTYTNSPKPIKNGEGGIRSRRTWQAVATDGRTFLKNPNLLTTLLTTNFLKPWQSLAISGRTFSSGISRSQRFWQLLATPEYKRKRRGRDSNPRQKLPPVTP